MDDLQGGAVNDLIAGIPWRTRANSHHPRGCRSVLSKCYRGGAYPGNLRKARLKRLIEDHAYGMIRWKQAVDGFADAGMTFGNPDFVAYAQSYGAQGHSTERRQDADRIIEDEQ